MARHARPAALLAATCAALALLGLQACGDDTTTPRDDTEAPQPDAMPPDDATAQDTAPGDTVPADTPPDIDPYDVAPEDVGPVDTWPADVPADEATPNDLTADIDTCGDGVVDPGEDCDDANPYERDGCTSSCRFGPRISPPAAGDIVFTELMLAPLAVAPQRGQWVELAVVRPGTFNLAGCELISSTAGAVALPEEVASGGARVVIARHGAPAENGGVVVDLEVTGLILDPTADTLALSCAGVTVDAVVWSNRTHAIVSGRALSLDPDRESEGANDAASAWCPAVDRFGAGDRGTPGSANPGCPGLDRVVDACQLVPMGADVAVFAGAPAGLSVDVRERGLTDLTDGADPTPLLRVELGLGQDLPVETGWTFVAAEATGAGASGGSDRYTAFVSPPEAGPHRVVGRASRDGGNTWTYCDLDGQTTPGAGGLDATTLLTLDALPNPCDTATCSTPPAASCDTSGLIAELPSPMGDCTPEAPDAFTCAYGVSSLDCTSEGRTCEDGGCTGIPGMPLPGEVRITELALAPDEGIAWVELESAADVARSLAGCGLESEAGLFVFPDVRVIRPKGHVVVAADAGMGPSEVPPGIAVDSAAGVLELTPLGGNLSLRCGAETIATLSWQAPDWDFGAGAPLGLSPFATDEEAALPDAWCSDDDAPETGSPGARNTPCPGDVVPIQTCRVIVPADTSPPAGATISVSVRFKATPDTARTNRTDPAETILVEGLLTPPGGVPDDGAMGILATPDATWIAVGSGVDPAEDRYRLVFRAPPAGSHRLWVRATADGGNGSVLCDIDGIVTDPTSARPLTLTTDPSACDPDPCGEAPELRCEGEVVMGPAMIGGATCEVDTDGAAQCTYPEVAREDCAAVGARCVAGACVDYPRPPTIGEVVFSELMIIPGSNEEGEWLELANPGPQSIELGGCVLGSDAPDGGAEAWAFPEAGGLSTVLMPGAAMAIARSGLGYVNGNIAPRFVWSALALDNAEDRVWLQCGEEIIDTVAWSSPAWALAPGRALALGAAAMDAEANDDPSAWCPPGSASPGAPNPLCRPAGAAPTSCRVALVTAAEALVGDEPMEAVVDIIDPGLSDRSAGSDPVIDTLVQVLLVEPGSDAFDLRDLRVFPATVLATEADTSGLPLDAGADRWRAVFTPGVAGRRDLLARVSTDAGRNFQLCDTEGLVDGGVPTPEALEIAAGVCVPNPCTSPPAAACSGSSIVWRSAPGTCTKASDGSASCSYGTRYFSCWSLGGCDVTTATCFDTRPTPTQPAELVIEEVMRVPNTVDPAAGEYVEIVNRTDIDLDLRGCELENEAGQVFTFTAPGPDLLRTNGGRLVLWGDPDSADNGGMYVYDATLRHLAGFRIANVAGELRLSCGGLLIDRVAWGPGWPGATPGVAMQLGSGAASATANDSPDAWCDATGPYGNGRNRGTPGGTNGTCEE